MAVSFNMPFSSTSALLYEILAYGAVGRLLSFLAGRTFTEKMGNAPTQPSLAPSPPG